MAKRGQTKPWRMSYTWDNGIAGVIAYGTQEEAEAAAEQQRQRVGPNGARCTRVEVTRRKGA